LASGVNTKALGVILRQNAAYGNQLAVTQRRRKAGESPASLSCSRRDRADPDLVVWARESDQQPPAAHPLQVGFRQIDGGPADGARVDGYGTMPLVLAI
jgi:hypothetical protein